MPPPPPRAVVVVLVDQVVRSPPSLPPGDVALPVVEVDVLAPTEIPEPLLDAIEGPVPQGPLGIVRGQIVRDDVELRPVRSSGGPARRGQLGQVARVPASGEDDVLPDVDVGPEGVRHRLEEAGDDQDLPLGPVRALDGGWGGGEGRGVLPGLGDAEVRIELVRRLLLDVHVHHAPAPVQSAPLLAPPPPSRPGGPVEHASDPARRSSSPVRYGKEERDRDQDAPVEAGDLGAGGGGGGAAPEPDDPPPPVLDLHDPIQAQVRHRVPDPGGDVGEDRPRELPRCRGDGRRPVRVPRREQRVGLRLQVPLLLRRRRRLPPRSPEGPGDRTRRRRRRRGGGGRGGIAPFPAPPPANLRLIRGGARGRVVVRASPGHAAPPGGAGPIALHGSGRTIRNRRQYYCTGNNGISKLYAYA